MSKPNYKEEQQKYRDMLKHNERMIWVSKDPSQPLIKGRTYIKPKEEKKEK